MKNPNRSRNGDGRSTLKLPSKNKISLFLKFVAIMICVGFNLSCSTTTPIEHTRGVASEPTELGSIPDGPGDRSLDEFANDPTLAGKIGRDLTFNLEDRLVVAKLKLPNNPDKHFLLVVGRDAKDDAGSYRVDLTKLGFEGDRIENVDPKFILMVNDEGVQSLRSFELGGPNRFKATVLNFINGQSTEDRPGLPPELLNVARSRQQVTAKDSIDILSGIPARFGYGLGTATAFINLFREEKERRKTYYGNYLSRLVDDVLTLKAEGTQLKNYLNSDQLNKVGCSLALRYTLYNNVVANHDLKAARGSALNVFRSCKNYYTYLAEVETQKRTKLQEVAAKAKVENAVLIPLSDSEAILARPLTDEERVQFKDTVGGNLLPLGLISVADGRTEVQLVDFQDPLKVGHQTYYNNLQNAATDVILTVIPAGKLVWDIQIARGLVLWSLSKTKQGQFLKRKDQTLNYAALQALMDMTSLNNPTFVRDEHLYGKLDDLYTQGILQSASEWGVPDDVVSELRKKSTTDENSKKEVLATLLQTIPDRELHEGRLRLVGDPNSDRILKNKKINVQRFIGWLKDKNQAANYELHHLFTRDEKAASKRNPSSEDFFD